MFSECYVPLAAGRLCQPCYCVYLQFAVAGSAAAYDMLCRVCFALALRKVKQCNGGVAHCLLTCEHQCSAVALLLALKRQYLYTCHGPDILPCY